MAKHGDVREDGKVFWSKRHGGGEIWLSRDSFDAAAEKLKARSLASYNKLRKDPEKLRAAHQRVRDWYHEDYRRGMLHRLRKKCLTTGIPFNLESIEDIPFVTHCPVFGVELAIGAKKQHDFSPSIDRIVPELGYTKGNVIVVSDLANRIKSNATPEQIMAVAKFYKKLRK